MGIPSIKKALASIPARQELLHSLAGYAHLKPLKTALEEEHPYVQWLTTSQTSDIRTIVAEEGYGAFLMGEDDIDTRFHAYLDTVIQQRIQLGVISDGKTPGSHDDRKLRWSNANGTLIVDQASDTLRLAVGPTWYQHCQMDMKRDPEAAFQLMLHGLKTHDDPYAFFAKGLGVVVIPLTRQGNAFIGKRAASCDYKSFLSFVSGWASFAAAVSEVDFFADLERELHEEIHLPPPLRKEHTTCIGLAGHPLTGEVDFVFVTQTNLDDDYFETRMWPEHERWYAIRNQDEARQLMNLGKIGNAKDYFQVMFSSHMGLDFLCNYHWSS